jgi:hypothetical protein
MDLASSIFVKEDSSMARYGKKAQEKVEKAMHERKRGTLKSGGSGKKVTSKKQAIAIGLAEARREGGKVPSSPSGKTRKTSAKRTTSTTRGTSAKSSTKKRSTKRATARRKAS